MQSSYQVVKNAIHFAKPDRIPMESESLGISDTHVVMCNQAITGDLTKTEDYDEWGCKWVRNELKNFGVVRGHPLANWKDLKTYHWPDPDDAAFYEGMDEKFEGGEGKYTLFAIFMFLFERMFALRGFENILTDLYLERENVEMLADRIVDYNIRVIHNVHQRYPDEIHGFKSSDDWGSELNTFISKGLWDEFFKPRYVRIFSECKKAGWDIWLHSCGRINDFIPSLIEVGCDVLNMQQPNTNGIDEIGKRFSGKICFSSLCDIQHTLPHRSSNEIEEEARELVYKWGTENGGFILSDYYDYEAIGVPVERKRIMLKAFSKHDRWKINR